MTAAIQALRRISTDNVSAICSLLLLSAVTRPYAGLTHDAKLYALQVLNSVQPGRYAEDLYLRFGSQDSFTLFSHLAGPPVAMFGLRITFVVFYLCSLSFFTWAALRFTRSLLGDPLVAFCSVAFVSVNPITFGGFEIFHVSESFLTPRLLATGLVLLSMERLLHEKWIQSLVLLAAALVCHPLMSFCGVLVWLCRCGVTVLGKRGFTVVLSLTLLAALAALNWAPLGTALFGEMDAAWKELVRASNPYLSPDQWLMRDWLRIVAAFVIAGAARWQLPLDTSTRRLVDAQMFVSALGLVVGLIAPFLPYALLFQGQPYRALWLVHFLQVPLGISLCRHCYRESWNGCRGWLPMIAAIYAAAYLSLPQVFASIIFLAAAWLGGIGRERSSGGSARWLGLAVAASAIPLIMPLAAARHLPQELMEWARLVPRMLGPLHTWLVGVLVLAVTRLWLKRAARFRGGIACLLACMLLVTLVPNITSNSKHVRFVADRLQELETEKPPTVYWTMAELDAVWVDLQAMSYFSLPQLSGNVFNRGTAFEGHRRAHIVAPFELSELALRSGGRVTWRHGLYDQVFGPEALNAKVTLDDLGQLCREDVDLAVLRQSFDGYYRARTGPWYLYECQKIRHKLAAELAASRSSPPPEVPLILTRHVSTKDADMHDVHVRDRSTKRPD